MAHNNEFDTEVGIHQLTKRSLLERNSGPQQDRITHQRNHQYSRYSPDDTKRHREKQTQALQPATATFTTTPHNKRARKKVTSEAERRRIPPPTLSLRFSGSEIFGIEVQEQCLTAICHCGVLGNLAGGLHQQSSLQNKTAPPTLPPQCTSSDTQNFGSDQAAFFLQAAGTPRTQETLATKAGGGSRSPAATQSRGPRERAP